MSAKRITLQLAAVSQIFVLVISSLGAASGRNKVRSPETVFSNPTSVAINTFAGTTAPNAAALYPSDVTVSGMTGTVTRVAVTLRGITSPKMNDLDYLLVGPGNEKYIFLSDVGSTSVVEDFVATITDDAFGTFPNSGPFSGTFKPTSGDGVADTFPAPAPAGPYNQPSGSPSFASVYNGINPNGTWSLYVVDDLVVNADSINSGWSLDITTTGTASTIFTNPSVISVNDTMMPASPYGTQINVTGQTGVISNLKVTLTGLTHTRVADVDVLLVSPNGKGLILMSDTGGTAAVSGVDLTFDDTAATTVPAVTFGSGTYRPTDFTSEVRDTFPYPAPFRPYHGSNASLSNFNGYSPNGIWTLYIVDDNGTQAGTLSGGWSLDVTTSPAPPPPPLTCSAPSFTPSNYSTGTKPTNFVTADFNNDTKPDLAVANQNSNDISILLGNGDGTFAPQSTISVGTGPYSIVAGKFDAGTTWDLAVTNSASNTVSVLLGNGDGTFGSPTSINVGPTPLSIAMGDFNEDSNTDLAVANFGGFLTGTISILLGNGSGGFSAGANVQTRSGPAFVAVADLNSGDTHDDLVVADFGAGSVSTYFGTGTGTFNLSQHINTGNGPIWVDMTSLGGDAFPDFRVANYNNDSATTCQGNANGTFTCNNATVGQNPTSITNADFTGAGGIPTRAVALSGTNTIDTNFGTIAVGQNPNAVRAVDLNNDTKMDLVSANSGSNNVTVMLNQCAAASGNLFDFNGDRRTEIGRAHV